MTMNKTGKDILKAGFGLAAVAAAAAGAYYFYGKEGARHRKHLKTWVVKAKAEVMEQIEAMSTVTEKSYEKAVSDVMGKYKKLKNVAPGEIAEVTKELKSHWKAIKKELDAAASGAAKAVNKVAKKAAIKR